MLVNDRGHVYIRTCENNIIERLKIIIGCRHPGERLQRIPETGRSEIYISPSIQKAPQEWRLELKVMFISETGKKYVQHIDVVVINHYRRV